MNDAKYIGLDVHQATISVVVLDSAGHLVMESIIESEPKQGSVSFASMPLNEFSFVDCCTWILS
jgi:hypothetical protein